MSRRTFLALAGTGVATPLVIKAATAMAGAPAARTPSAPRAAAVIRVPAEFEPHARCLVSWPWRKGLYIGHLEECQQELAKIIRRIAGFEPVTVVANPGDRRQVRRMVGSVDIDIIELPIDDGWIRDNGPIFTEHDGTLTGVDFRFDGWGQTFPNHAMDDALPPLLCDRLGIPSRSDPTILEGGAIQWDGENTIITTEECLLARNPSMTKGDYEAMFLAELGITKVIWLPFGMLDDWVTGGHVDGVVQFAGPAKVVALTDPGGREDARTAANLAVLQAATDAQGRSLEIAKIPFMPRFDGIGPGKLTHSYVNFYLPDGGVIAPTCGLRVPDSKALGRIRDAFPGRDVVGVQTNALSWAGGGPHCVTMPVPA
ncbi:MAG: agmatine deiminase family protein [Actinomycetota bacterium]